MNFQLFSLDCAHNIIATEFMYAAAKRNTKAKAKFFMEDLLHFDYMQNVLFNYCAENRNEIEKKIFLCKNNETIL